MKYESLSEIERNSWIDFHKWAYEDDLKQANETKSPRWKIIQGYYSMHDLAKLFLGKKFNLKINPPEIHAQVIEALEENLKGINKEKIINLLNKAQEKFKDIELKRLEDVIELLKEAKRQRGKSQYYSDRFSISIFEEMSETFMLKVSEHAQEPPKLMEWLIGLSISYHSSSMVVLDRLKKEADEFIKNVVNPFIEIMEALLNDRNNTRK